METPVGKSGANGEYQPDDFEQVQAELARPRTDEVDPDFIFDFYLESISRLGGAMLASIQADKYPIYRYKLRQVLEEIEKKFGTWPDLNEHLRTNIDVAMSESPPYTMLVTTPVAKAIKKLTAQKQKQERAARRRKNTPQPR